MLQKLLINLAANKTRTEILEGREYIVCPMVMITEGVHNGSKGPLFYSASELSKTATAWDHKPIVVYHPEIDGVGVSACNPAILNTCKVGIILNTKWAGKLRAEAWIDKLRAAEVDQRILDAISKNQVMELSTGLFTDDEVKDGEFKGKKYVAIARNYRPDHLALLPDKTGACSVKDGAGLLVNEQANSRSFSTKERKKLARKGHAMKDGSFPIESKEDLQNAIRAIGRAKNPAGAKRHIIRRAKALGAEDLIPDDWKMTGNAMSYMDIVSALRGVLASKLGQPGVSWGGYIEDVFPDSVVYCDGGDLYRVGYDVSENSITLIGTPERVVRTIEYQQAPPDDEGDDGPTGNKGNNMTKDEIIKSLITNGVFEESDRPYLTGLKDERLTAMMAKLTSPTPTPAVVPTPTPTPVPTPTPTPAPTVVNQEPAVVPVLNQQPVPPQTLEQYISSAPAGIRELLTNSLKAHEAEKGRLIAVITANTSNTFTKEWLATRSLEELSGMAALAGAQANAQNRHPMYLGAGFTPAPAINAVPEEGLPLPSMDFEDTRKK